MSTDQYLLELREKNTAKSYRRRTRTNFETHTNLANKAGRT
jgi:hypothetical protein